MRQQSSVTASAELELALLVHTQSASTRSEPSSLLPFPAPSLGFASWCKENQILDQCPSLPSLQLVMDPIPAAPLGHSWHHLPSPPGQSLSLHITESFGLEKTSKITESNP